MGEKEWLSSAKAVRVPGQAFLDLRQQLDTFFL